MTLTVLEIIFYIVSAVPQFEVVFFFFFKYMEVIGLGKEYHRREMLLLIILYHVIRLTSLVILTLIIWLI